MAWDPALKQSPRGCAGCHDAFPKAERATRPNRNLDGGSGECNYTWPRLRLHY